MIWLNNCLIHFSTSSLIVFWLSFKKNMTLIKCIRHFFVCVCELYCKFKLTLIEIKVLLNLCTLYFCFIFAWKNKRFRFSFFKSVQTRVWNAEKQCCMQLLAEPAHLNTDIQSKVHTLSMTFLHVRCNPAKGRVDFEDGCLVK
jgi:hypothetical protein